MAPKAPSDGCARDTDLFRDWEVAFRADNTAFGNAKITMAGTMSEAYFRMASAMSRRKLWKALIESSNALELEENIARLSGHRPPSTTSRATSEDGTAGHSGAFAPWADEMRAWRASTIDKIVQSKGNMTAEEFKRELDCVSSQFEARVRGKALAVQVHPPEPVVVGDSSTPGGQTRRRRASSASCASRPLDTAWGSEDASAGATASDGKLQLIRATGSRAVTFNEDGSAVRHFDKDGPPTSISRQSAVESDSGSEDDNLVVQPSSPRHRRRYSESDFMPGTAVMSRAGSYVNNGTVENRHEHKYVLFDNLKLDFRNFFRLDASRFWAGMFAWTGGGGNATTNATVGLDPASAKLDQLWPLLAVLLFPVFVLYKIARWGRHLGPCLAILLYALIAASFVVVYLANNSVRGEAMAASFRLLWFMEAIYKLARLSLLPTRKFVDICRLTAPLFSFLLGGTSSGSVLKSVTTTPRHNPLPDTTPRYTYPAFPDTSTPDAAISALSDEETMMAASGLFISSFISHSQAIRAAHALASAELEALRDIAARSDETAEKMQIMQKAISNFGEVVDRLKRLRQKEEAAKVAFRRDLQQIHRRASSMRDRAGTCAALLASPWAMASRPRLAWACWQDIGYEPGEMSQRLRLLNDKILLDLQAAYKNYRGVLDNRYNEVEKLEPVGKNLFKKAGSARDALEVLAGAVAGYGTGRAAADRRQATVDDAVELTQLSRLTDAALGFLLYVEDSGKEVLEWKQARQDEIRRLLERVEVRSLGDTSGSLESERLDEICNGIENLLGRLDEHDVGAAQMM